MKNRSELARVVMALGLLIVLCALAWGSLPTGAVGAAVFTAGEALRK